MAYSEITDAEKAVSAAADTDLFSKLVNNPIAHGSRDSTALAPVLTIDAGTDSDGNTVDNDYPILTDQITANKTYTTGVAAQFKLHIFQHTDSSADVTCVVTTGGSATTTALSDGQNVITTASLAKGSTIVISGSTVKHNILICMNKDQNFQPANNFSAVHIPGSFTDVSQDLGSAGSQDISWQIWPI
tara:strand:- start:5452 stop:6015 length:564 start_codon:yes stop_codon:yes gene_type:complete